MDFTQILSAMRKSAGDVEPLEVSDISFKSDIKVENYHSSAPVQIAHLHAVDVSSLDLERSEIGAVKLESLQKFIKHNYNTFTKE